MKEHLKFKSNMGEVEFNDTSIKIKRSGIMGNCITNQFKNNINRLRLLYCTLLITAIYCVLDSYLKGDSFASILNTATYIIWFVYLVYNTKGKTLVSEIDKDSVTNISFKKGIWCVRNSAIVVE